MKIKRYISSLRTLYSKMVQQRAKKDIFQRKNYLVSKLVSSPKTILNSMPKAIGPQFQGEWALYSCSMFTQALVNIAKLYPETKDSSRQIVHALIMEVMSSEMRAYDREQWNMEDPLESLSWGTEIKHLSYRSHLAWMICNYKSLGGNTDFDSLLHKLCKALASGINSSPAMNLPTYSDMAVYIPDMLVAVVALHLYGKLFDEEYGETVRKWMYKARKDWIDEQTGLLVSYMSYKGTPFGGVRGSYSALNIYYLSFIDKSFAEKQYILLKKVFLHKRILTGCKEYVHNTNKLITFDVDAGPVIMDMSPSGTAFLIGCATAFHDFPIRKKLLCTAGIVGMTFAFRNKRHYLLSNIAPVGEAIVLAMKTTY